PLFSVWRLAWIAHQLPRDPGHLFDANIFYPARDTLALSDSILLPGLVAAPFIWLGASPVRVYNLWFMATFVLSALAMYALVRALTGHRGAALVAAVAFAFYPFRFERYSTFEMQLSFWMPLALLAVHRAMATGRRRWGLLAGLAFAAQVYSCMYFAAFLVVFLVPLCFVLAWARGHLVRRLSPLLPGALLAAALIFPLALAYVSAREQFGGRDLGEVTYFSATAARYLVPSAANATWTTLWPDSARLAERDLFPGALIVVLALVAVWPPLSRSRAAYAVALLVAFDASLGVHGHVYPWLYGYAAPFRSIRVPARFSMLVGMALAVLAGYGAARVAGRPKSRAAAWVLVAAMCATVCVESRPVLAFQEPCRLHAIYSWFHGRPTSVIAELPAPGRVAERLFEDVRYQYWSTFHWNKLVNGYSGILPRMYLTFSAQMTEFPDDASLAVLKQRGVEYVVVHEEFYDDRALYRRVVGASARRADLVEAARAVDRGTEARIYRVVR
ncbi:MAG: glycosyltransferase family 39 protein, partial [Bacteroidales bacterium]